MAGKSKSIRNRGKRRKIGPLELDITSLLDILVILLVFLLKSYNSSGIVFSVPKEVKLPFSHSSSPGSAGVMVQVSPSMIWVEDKVVVNSRNMINRATFDDQGRRIIPLYNELIKIKRTSKIVEKSSPNAKKFSGVINLIVDKSVKYSFVKKLMYTAAEAGYQKYKFVVRGEE
ncbi:MAG: biopolymer transporter ExbD [Bacteriovoracaceae bacterium]